MKKLNKTQQAILATAHDNAHGTGWVKAPNLRPTTKAALAELREAGIIEYTVTDGWAGNKLTTAGAEWVK